MKKKKMDPAGAPDDPKMKKEIAKAYENYSSQFTPKPRYWMNGLRAFVSGGLICTASLWLEERFIAWGFSEKTAAVCVVMILIMLAQLLTGLGLFDSIAKFAGAGVVVPITGFANSMVAPAIEYKKVSCWAWAPSCFPWRVRCWCAVSPHLCSSGSCTG